MNYMALIKLLYLADRESLIKYGRPITFDIYCSMSHGPVLSTTYDMISHYEVRSDNYWQEYISDHHDYEVQLIKEVPTDHISRADQEILDETHAQYGHMTPWELRDLTHELPEWQDPEGSSLPIEIEDILRGAGLSKDEAKEIVEGLGAEESADLLWS